MWGKILVSLLIIAPVFISGAGAATVDLAPIAIGNVVDDAGGIADGIFDRVESSTFPEVDATNNFTYRAVMEFSVSSFPILSVNSAHLVWTIGNATDPPVTVQLHGYSGDG